MSRKLSSFLAILFCLSCVSIYLVQWWSTPLYPDEVAFRLLTGRLFSDGPINYGLFSFCISNTRPIEPLILPTHYILSLMDNETGWSMLRILPFASITILISSALALVYRFTKRTRWGVWPAALLLTGAFIGVAGSGLMLSRPEYFLALNASVCILTLFYAWQRNRQVWLTSIIIILNLFITMLSAGAHPQGVLFLPLSFLSCLQLVKKPLPIAFIAISLIAIGYQTFQNFNVHCAENPELEYVLKKYQGGPTTNVHPEFSYAKSLWVNARRNIDKITFNQHYFYLPQHEGTLYKTQAWYLNKGIGLLWILTIITTLCVSIRTFYELIQSFIHDINNSLLKRCVLLVQDVKIIVFYAAISLLFLYFYDVTINFYRVFYRNMLAVVLIATCIPFLKKPLLRIGFTWLAGCSTAICITSIFMSAAYFRPSLALESGGVSIPLDTDWQEVNAEVDILTQRCGIKKDEEKLVIDDMTYNALRQHRHLIPITYLWFDMALIPGSHAGENGKDRLVALMSLKPGGIIARCGSFISMQLPFNEQQGNLCCLKMDEK